MRSAVLILAFAASAVTAAVVPVPVPATLPLPLGEISWKGIVNAGEPEVEVWGWSFEEIEGKIREEFNPDFKIYTELDVQAAPEVSADPAVVARDQLQKRNAICDKRFGQVGTISTGDLVRNLRGIPQCGARARTCILMQCNHLGAGIGMCNDNHHNYNMPCSVAADMAQTILNQCVEAFPTCDNHGNCQNSPWNWLTAGQLFSNQGFNIIVGACGFFAPGERPVKA